MGEVEDGKLRCFYHGWAFGEDGNCVDIPTVGMGAAKKPTDLRNFTQLDPSPDCTDAADESKPLREFTPGGENQLMMLRACAKLRQEQGGAAPEQET